MISYAIEELAPIFPLDPPLGLSNLSFAWALDEQGNAAGWVANGLGSRLDPVRWEGSVPHLLPSANVGASASGLNDIGQVVGVLGMEPPQAFLYTPQGSGNPAQLQDLSQVLGPDLSWADDINNDGIVVGTVGGFINAERPFIYDSKSGEQPVLLEPLPGDSYAHAYAINEAGDVAGVSGGTQGSGCHAFIFKNGLMSDLGPVDLEGLADLNDSGVTTGWVSGQAFRLDSSAANLVPEKLPPLPDQSASWGFGINNDGVVVGQYSDHQVETRAFVNFPSSYLTPGSLDLQTLVANPSDWLLLAAYDINNKGQIVGVGRHQRDANEQTRAFLLTPITSGLALDRIEGLLAAFVMLLGGIPQGGGGWGVPFGWGYPIPIPPHEPIVSILQRLLPVWSRLSQPERDILLGSVIKRLTLLTENPENKRLLEQTGRAIGKSAIEELGRSK